jgi:hypothetical protein
MAVVEICHLYISPGHNFFGHHGREPNDYPAIEVPMVECVAGQGIRGDRFFDYQEDYKAKSHFSRSRCSMSFVARLKFRIAHLRSCVATR